MKPETGSKAKKRENAQTAIEGSKRAKLTVKHKSKKPVNGDSNEPAVVKASKKLPLLSNGDENGKNDEVNSSASEATPAAPSKLGGNINKAVFGIFKKLQDKPQGQKHLNELIGLLKDETNVVQRQATCAYVLKRLVRSTGADDKQAVVQNATYLNSILRAVPGIDLINLLQNMKRDLPVGGQIKGKEDSLAAVGQIITVYSIIQTPRFENATPELIGAIYEILLAHMKVREYLIGLCSQIMADSFKQLSASNFERLVCPVLLPLVAKPCSAQKLHTCDLLLAVHLNYPQVLTRVQLELSLWDKKAQFEQLFDLYLNSVQSKGDGAHQRLAKFIGSDEQLLLAWQQHVDATPPKHSATKICIIEVLSGVLLNYQESQQQPQTLVKLFSAPFISMLMAELRAAKQKRMPAKRSQLQLRASCHAFEAALQQSFGRVLNDDDSKLEILRRLLQAQLQLDSVMQTPRFTYQLLKHLSWNGLRQVYELYRDILVANDEETSRATREHCLNQMQYILLHAELDEAATPEMSKWRDEQLAFLLLAGLFHLNAAQKPCASNEAAAYSQQTATRCEEVFFTCLLHKCEEGNLEALCQTLRHHVKVLNKQLGKPDAEQKLRVPRSPSTQKSWTHVQQTLKLPSDGKDALNLAHEALILFMGLVLCTRHNLSVELLDDVVICWQRARDQQAGVPSTQKDEVPWQDVVTSVLLQLLLQTGHFWRQFVNAICASMVSCLGRDNLEQILDILDMTKNPLSEKNDEQEDNEVDSEMDTSDGDEVNDEDDDDEDDDDEDDDDADDETRLEQVRESVREALTNDDNDDASSVDWNDVAEEQGERLNAALERAFQAFKPKSRKAQQQRQTKSERISSTKLLHFRVRVLDLVGLFVAKQPHMSIMLDALCSVYQVYKFSSGDTKLQSLREASMKLLRKLLGKPINYDANDKPAMMECIERFMAPSAAQKQLTTATKEAAPRADGDIGEWRNKCVAYLVSRFRADDSMPVCTLIEGYVGDWMGKRNSVHSLATFEALLLAQWPGAPQLAATFAAHLSGSESRGMRRVQILTALHKHQRQVAASLSRNKEQAKRFVESLENYKRSMTDPNGDKAPPTRKEAKLMAKVLGYQWNRS